MNDKIRDVYIQVVNKRDVETLIPILKERVHSQSTIHIDYWKAYGRVNENFKVHFTVNHSKFLLTQRLNTILK
ncbi:hypothetical protein HERIO_1682 [Hepatospora eriocheir]|uniref:ISXO2-like transposase domain-containing protein n=1 Tax=Hepatospora eriocheir TaxID=1081669 RepID=A0A1X0Q9C9_9MICR|nr:hypothetical protein HERIO_1682 [Hepatospora eriocheir]